MIKNEYPRPQFQRKDWICLNGPWTYHIRRIAPYQRQQKDRLEIINSKGLEKTIMVPFAPETKMSGSLESGIISYMYYHKSIIVPKGWESKSVILHFEAVYYHSEVFINGKLIGTHDGGSTPFSFDITNHIVFGEEFDCIVKVCTDRNSGNEASGKQSSLVESYECYYQRTTGIWQSVWMECVDYNALKSIKYNWDGNKYLTIIPEFYHISKNQSFEVKVIDDNTIVSSVTIKSNIQNSAIIEIPNPKLWDTESPSLYDIELTTLINDQVVDTVYSYYGLRTIATQDNQILLNGKKTYLRLVLDQGFYGESNWTSPSEEALINDIKLSINAGFNGARLHQKVFEERFFYHADRLGYLLWAESPSWGLDYNNDALPARNFLSEWASIIKRDINHPSIIAWTPLNETYLCRNKWAHRRLHEEAYNLTKLIDPSRPVNDASGYIHYLTDLWTVHTYEQNPKKLDEILSSTKEEIFRCYPMLESKYDNQPYLVDEFGGIKWDPNTQNDGKLSFSQNLDSWGYGQSPQSLEEFYERLEGLVNAILSKKHIMGYCYTQLTDVEQEKNGIYFYNRDLKFDMTRIKNIFSKTPENF